MKQCEERKLETRRTDHVTMWEYTETSNFYKLLAKQIKSYIKFYTQSNGVFFKNEIGLAFRSQQNQFTRVTNQKKKN